ncbi:hypothetical protein H7849_20495 [Alloacidobacterium dinghuense]|uniref:Uncharacterized protein n=1 Tax=Alloacidobacterium dinghuense TaxID=2763107 RepID=A0A7G8BFW2_9BACT|nr:hypothetical protein [Alloacidobacterium dinghuense]QNI31432.1 hypothetical protein H7849_20495 [Alloacidobacterium dinghuense]
MNLKQEIRLTPKSWTTRVEAETWRLRNIVLIFLLCAFGFLLLATMGIFFLQGFRVRGFDLPTNVLLWLGGATIGEVAGLLVLCIRTVFISPDLRKTPRRKPKNPALLDLPKSPARLRGIP